MMELIGYRARQPSAMHWNQLSSCVRGGILGRIDDPAAAANSQLRMPAGAFSQRRSEQRERGERTGPFESRQSSNRGDRLLGPRPVARTSDRGHCASTFAQGTRPPTRPVNAPRIWLRMPTRPTTLFSRSSAVQTRLPTGADESPERSIAIGWVVTKSPRTFRFTAPRFRWSAVQVAVCWGETCGWASKALEDEAGAAWLAAVTWTGRATSPTTAVPAPTRAVPAATVPLTIPIATTWLARASNLRMLSVPANAAPLEADPTIGTCSAGGSLFGAAVAAVASSRTAIGMHALRCERLIMSSYLPAATKQSTVWSRQGERCPRKLVHVLDMASMASAGSDCHTCSRMDWNPADRPGAWARAPGSGVRSLAGASGG